MCSAMYLCRNLSGQIIDKFYWASRIPYLLAKADKPQVAKECLAQYDSAALPETQHRISRRFCSKGAGSLGCLMEACAESGTPPPELVREVAVLRLGRMAEDTHSS